LNNFSEGEGESVVVVKKKELIRGYGEKAERTFRFLNAHHNQNAGVGGTRLGAV